MWQLRTEREEENKVKMVMREGDNMGKWGEINKMTETMN